MKLSIVFPIALLLVAASPALAQTIRLEAETFVDQHDLGGLVIRIQGCSQASQGYAVDGLDRAGEWIRLELDLLEDRCFVDSVRSAGSEGTIRTYALQFQLRDGGGIWAADTLTTPPGSGIT